MEASKVNLWKTTLRNPNYLDNAFNKGVGT
jgi:hypothetical protein